MAWELVPCLDRLRTEFNAVAPGRDKGADGAIGDSAHTSSSDHTPDEDSDVLRDHDADSKNEVHALDIDSTGPWPESFDAIIKRLVAREKAEYESATVVGRLKYVIWNRRIAERSNGWNWRDYTLADPHTNHAHFSARYLSSTEADTRPWGVYEEDNMPTADEIAKAVWSYPLEDPRSSTSPRGKKAAGTLLRYQELVAVGQGDRLAAAVAALAGKDPVDEQAIVAGILAGLPAERIAAAIPVELAQQVADELAARLQS